MAIEKMTMMNVVGPIEYVDNVTRDIVLMENVDIVNAFNEIKESHFTINVAEENVKELVDMNFIKPLSENRDYKKLWDKMNTIKNIYNKEFIINKKCLNKHYDFNECIIEINDLFNKLVNPYEKLSSLKEELVKIEKFYKNFSHMSEFNIPIEKLKNMKYFTTIVGVLSKEAKLKLKKNYENISAIVVHVGSSEIGEVYMIISPRDLEVETNRILRSLNFHEIGIPDGYTGTPSEISKKLELRKKKIVDEINQLERELEKLKNENVVKATDLYSKLKMEQRVGEVKKEMVFTQNFFYFSGWVPETQKRKIKGTLGKYKGMIIMYKEDENIDSFLRPPTKLKNNMIFRPFEYLVNMYGVPCYDELDPTPFLSITYMALFGAMFGDFGQGLVLFLAGILLNRKNKKSLLSGILSRLGASSMVFGVLYGAVFGFEDIIPALFIRPFNNINTVLIGAVLIGIILTLISYIFSIINLLKRKNIEEGVFGRNGIVGLSFYLILLLLVGSIIKKINILPNSIYILLLVILAVLMVLKQPLANIIIKKKPLYSESPSSYYIESGFSLLETLLSMLSGTISFIRVGAFALTHVGLFIAFETIAKLMGSFAGSIVMLIVGNIIIIGLEGLIVFIQGLRLEYYELFSKYYRGEGREFKPVRL